MMSSEFTVVNFLQAIPAAVLSLHYTFIDIVHQESMDRLLPSA